ncbi:tRNA pseudouridine32 synthase/23S rRNA pseudouridine746 synthase/23S rRNA pseudouridine1911/1915/1917 synthase [Stackebrandtia soli]
MCADLAIVDDADALALNKPVGISVTGERHGTDLVRMAAEAGETLYPVHRIDKATSGLILFTRTLPAHGPLTRQFQQRTVDKTYLAVTASRDVPDHGVIDLPLSVGRKNRVRVAGRRDAIVREGDTWTVPVDSDVTSYPSLTRFVVLWRNRRHTLLALRPVTGRRHQIRVHLAWIGHAIVGDPLFEPDPQTRTLLHSWRLSLDATWLDGERLTLEAKPGDDFIDAAGITNVDGMFAHAEKVLPALSTSEAVE